MTLARDYDAATEPRGVLRHLLPVFGYPVLVWRNRYLVQNFFRRDLLARFHGSFLGAGWMLVQPLFLFSVYYLVFGLLWGNWRWGVAPDGTLALYMFSGVIVFHAIIEASTTCCSIIVANGNLVKKVAFPSEVLPVHVALVSLLIYAIGAVVFVVACALLGQFTPGPLMLALPLVLLAQFVLTIGLGLLLANAEVFARDVSQLWRIVGTAWMFLSPVFWYPKMVLGKFEDATLPNLFFDLNPLFGLMQAHRIVLGGHLVDPGDGMPVVQPGELWHHLGMAWLWAAALFVVGYSTFTSNKHKHADLV